MKKNLLFLIVLMLSAFTMSATVPAFDEDPDEIDLQKQQNGDDPTSLSVCSIQAFKTGTHVIVYFSNYYGNASAIVFGIGGTAFSGQQFIEGAGYLSVDISALPSGSYSLTVFADAVYSGSFQL